MTEKINGKEVVGTLTVKPDSETEWLAKILKCNCPAKAGLEVHPLSRDLRAFRGLTVEQALELVRQQGWGYHMAYNRDDG